MASNLESDKSIKNIFWSLVLVTSLILPSGFGGFTAIYLYGFLISITILFQGDNNKVSVRKASFVTLVLFCFLSGAFLNANNVYNLWEYREYIRIPLLISSVFIIKANRISVVKIFIVSMSFVIFADFIFFHLLKNSSISITLNELFLMRGMEVLEGSYWRHIGIGGNPNVSSTIYSITILVFTNFLIFNLARGYLFKLLVMMVIFLSIYLLLLTYSRTGMVSLLFALSFLLLFNRPKLIVPFVLIMTFCLFLLVPTFFYSLLERFMSFSSFDARIVHWEGLLERYNTFIFLFGSSLNVSVVDNDYLYFAFRFGFFGFLFLVITPIYVLFKIKDEFLRNTYFSLIVFYYVGAFPGGTLANPKAYIFLVVLGCLSMNSKVSIGEKK
ncbi:hypothetical protein [Vibrio coralliirubri]|uniref:hypothetical protein n=1 Tax=Vibrio coralliirubri TaxID=1516159 RepID=UPI0013C42824|nr:hypothetical protein [Vibrio coralliirubri]